MWRTEATPIEHLGPRRALLLTDVVDSTRLSESLGDQAMAALWAAHDRVARDLLPLHQGREIDKTDGFLLLFDAASDAVGYAVAYHRALSALNPPIQARAGLHVGPVILTENAPADIARGAKPLEVDGLAKPTAARIMSIALGGQTLLSPSACEALGDTALRVESHGHWRMKGVSEPIELFEVGDAEAPFTPPADSAKVYRVVEQGDLWLPVKQIRNSLPAERDSFVGRQADLLALSQRLDGEARLVSVLGIGGTGKTRLVTRYGWTWLGDYPGGVWFCDLSDARDIDGIFSAVSRALEVPPGREDPVVQLGHAIAGRGRCLVILDNFEQVARLAEDTLGAWLDRAGEAQFVVTTREVLGLPGEEALALAPLPRSDGAALFMSRARSAKRDFEPDDAASIEALVTLLDGLPLAIELAAARVRVMPPAQLLARMSQRFKLLSSSGGRRDRQATLRATLDWSWELLSPDEQAALAQLAVFEGGFTLEAAEAVLVLDEAWPMDAVQALVDKSLVVQVTEARFQLLVSVQEYAAEQLAALGGRAEAEARHGDWFAGMGTDAALAALERTGGLAPRRALVLERDNLIAACRRAVARGDGPEATNTLLAAWVVLQARGPIALGLELGAGVLGLALAPADRSRARRCHGTILWRLGRLEEARVCCDKALEEARAVGAHSLEGFLLVDLGDLPLAGGQAETARTRYEDALAAARALGDRHLEGRVLGRLGSVSAHRGQVDEARRHEETALAIARELGDRRHEASMLGNLGVLHWQQGRLDEALTHYEAALVIAREYGDRQSEALHLGNLGAILATQGRIDGAREYLDAALVVTREVGGRRYEGHLLDNLAGLHSVQGGLDAARAGYEAALGVVRQVGDRRKEAHVLDGLGIVLQGMGRPDEAHAHFEAALEILRQVGDRRYEGLVLGDLGDLLRSRDQRDEARQCFDAALGIAREVRDRFLEGIVLGRAADLMRIESRLGEARASLAEGERLLRETAPGSGNLADLLCIRARLEHAEDATDAARATLAEAEAIAASVGTGRLSALGRNLDRTRSALGSTGHW